MITEIEKFLSTIADYDIFTQCKDKYIKEHSKENYFAMINSYMSVDSELKSMLSSGFLSYDDFVCMRKKLKEGVYNDDF